MRTSKKSSPHPTVLNSSHHQPPTSALILRKMYNQNSLIVPIKLFLTLIVGIIIGFTFAQLLSETNCECLGITTSLRNQDTSNEPQKQSLAQPQKSAAEESSNIDIQEVEEDVEVEAKLDSTIVTQSEFKSELLVFNANRFNDQNTTIADQLYNEVRVLCWVLTMPQNHEKKAMHIKNTWGSRCNKLIFMSTEADAELGAIKLPVAEGRGHLWNKTREAMKYIYENYLNDYDWFVKADDDTYIIAENLRLFLYPYDTSSPVYFGCKFKPHVRQGYMSGGAGYVLSQEAVKRFIEKAYPNRSICRQSLGGTEDKEMGLCLQNVGIVAGDTRDEHKRGRFFPSGPNGHIIPKNRSHWYWRYIFYSTEDGLNCCSDYAISFHYIHPDHMYVLDYLIYTLRPFGIVPKSMELPKKMTATVAADLMEKWRTEKSDNPLS